MPGLNKRAFSVDKPCYPPRPSPTESIPFFATASTSGKERNIAAVSEGWPAFARAGFIPLVMGTKPRMSPPTFEPSQQKKQTRKALFWLDSGWLQLARTSTFWRTHLRRSSWSPTNTQARITSCQAASD